MGPIYCHIILLLYNSQTDYLVSLDVSLLFGKRETATLEGNETIMKTGNLVYQIHLSKGNEKQCY